MPRCWVRLNIAETPAFRNALAHKAPERVPVGQVLAHHARGVIAGAAGVLLRDGDGARIHGALSAVVAGLTVVDAPFREALLRVSVALEGEARSDRAGEELTAREREVLALLAQALATQASAGHLAGMLSAQWLTGQVCTSAGTLAPAAHVRLRYVTEVTVAASGFAVPGPGEGGLCGTTGGGAAENPSTSAPTTVRSGPDGTAAPDATATGRLAARISSSSATTSSGGSPPSLALRLIDPRVGWKRIPRSRAATIEAPRRSPAPRGGT